MENTTNEQPVAESKVLKITILIERCLFAIAILGILFKLMGWPGGLAFLMLGLSTLSMILIIRGVVSMLVFKFPKPSGIALVTVLFMNVSSGFLINGYLFKMMGWPGALVTLLFGLLTVFVSIVMFLATNKTSQTKRVLMPLGIKTITLFLIGCVLFALSNVQLYRLIGTYKNDEHYMELMQNCADDHSNCDSLRAYQQELIMQRRQNNQNQ